MSETNIQLNLGQEVRNGEVEPAFAGIAEIPPSTQETTYLHSQENRSVGPVEIGRSMLGSQLRLIIL